MRVAIEGDTETSTMYLHVLVNHSHGKMLRETVSLGIMFNFDIEFMITPPLSMMCLAYWAVTNASFSSRVLVLFPPLKILENLGDFP